MPRLVHLGRFDRWVAFIIVYNSLWVTLQATSREVDHAPRGLEGLDHLVCGVALLARHHRPFGAQARAMYRIFQSMSRPGQASPGCQGPLPHTGTSAPCRICTSPWVYMPLPEALRAASSIALVFYHQLHGMEELLGCL